jgi:Spy/CpxP family protein refolding chaperone
MRFLHPMKTSIKSIAIAALALLSTTQLINAQDDKKPEGRPDGQRRGGSPEERLKMMTEKLGLTQEQQDKIKAIFAKNADAMKAMREKGRENLTEEDKTKMREAMKSQMEEVAAVLTEEQKTKWKESFQRRGPGGDRKPEDKK